MTGAVDGIDRPEVGRRERFRERPPAQPGRTWRALTDYGIPRGKGASSALSNAGVRRPEHPFGVASLKALGTDGSSFGVSTS